MEKEKDEIFKKEAKIACREIIETLNLKKFGEEAWVLAMMHLICKATIVANATKEELLGSIAGIFDAMEKHEKQSKV